MFNDQARYWFLWVRCSAGRSISSIDLYARHPHENVQRKLRRNSKSRRR
jgi:hypothetical protein